MARTEADFEHLLRAFATEHHDRPYRFHTQAERERWKQERARRRRRSWERWLREHPHLASRRVRYLP